MVKRSTRSIERLEQLAVMTKKVGRMLEWVCIRYNVNKSLEQTFKCCDGIKQQN